ncbi:MAG: NAD(+)--dinitrogen-reductase ADP-D-ribosyltransferase [Betaproteobacteria bacterium]|nr:NAD(+)--dinitrogen-reductase ADP-D-ribosyltransferase [Betaproteobacteria bacterium]
MPNDRNVEPRSHSTNLVGIPTGLLASSAFNEHPLKLSINGVRETNPALFAMLEDATCAAEAMEAFQNYMRTVFGLEPQQRRGEGGQRFRASYLRLLAGWGFDANGPEGAVLKGWVESRFGILPTFHKGPLGRYPSPAWIAYVVEKMSARFHNNSIHLQLDLLYEYCQWMLARFLSPGRHHLTLYRGVNDFAEHQLIEPLGRREAIARQNNLVSFSAERDIADQFGDTILEARVPVAKIVFFNALLPGHVLRGEGEYLVIGGDYRVRLAYL